MPGRILIIDKIATNRIVLKVKLASARYDVTVCSQSDEAVDVIRATMPHLVIAGANSLTPAVTDCIIESRGSAGRLTMPVIAITKDRGTDARAVLLGAGADEVLERPVAEVTLLARVRSLLRARAASSDLRPHEDTSFALGFAEKPEGFAPAPRVVLLAPPTRQSARLSRHLGRAGFRPAAIVDPMNAFLDGSLTADVYVIDAQHAWSVAEDSAVFGLISDLRSRPESRHAAILLVAAETAADIRSMAFDLGADDVVDFDAGAEELRLRLGSLARQVTAMSGLRETMRSGLEAAVHDHLTGLHNRRYAMPRLSRMLKATHDAPEISQVGVMVIDIDYFKRINDRYGHGVGDRVLVEIASRLQSCLRPADLIARIGGEEFLVALSHTGKSDALETAERLRQVVESHEIRCGSDRIQVTLSIGVAVSALTESGEDASAILRRADRALFGAKSRGRNKVNLSSPAAA